MPLPTVTPTLESSAVIAVGVPPEPFTPLFCWTNIGLSSGNIKYDYGNPSYDVIGYGSYLNDGTNESYWADGTFDGGVSDDGGVAGIKLANGMNFFNVIVASDEIQVALIAQDYDDPDDLTAPAASFTTLATPATTPDNLSYYAPASVATKFSTMNFGDGSALVSRALIYEMNVSTVDGPFQAYEYETGETGASNRYHLSHLFVDGSYWMLAHVNYGAAEHYQLIRFTKTDIGQPYDYDKWDLTFADAALNTVLAAGDAAIVGFTADSFVIGFTHASFPLGVKVVEMYYDGSTYREWEFTGEAFVEGFMDLNGISAAKANYASLNAPRIYGFAYEGDYVSGPGSTPGTYLLEATPGTTATPQAAAYTETIQRRAPLTQIVTGTRIPAGDMDSGSDRRITSTGDVRIWQDTIDGR